MQLCSSLAERCSVGADHLRAVRCQCHHVSRDGCGGEVIDAAPAVRCPHAGPSGDAATPAEEQPDTPVAVRRDLVALVRDGRPERFEDDLVAAWAEAGGDRQAVLFECGCLVG